VEKQGWDEAYESLVNEERESFPPEDGRSQVHVCVSVWDTGCGYQSLFGEHSRASSISSVSTCAGSGGIVHTAVAI
jgi:hypothetical protein